MAASNEIKITRTESPFNRSQIDWLKENLTIETQEHKENYGDGNNFFVIKLLLDGDEISSDYINL